MGLFLCGFLAQFEGHVNSRAVLYTVALPPHLLQCEELLAAMVYGLCVDGAENLSSTRVGRKLTVPITVPKP